VYTNGDSRVGSDVRWMFPHGEWPLIDPSASHLKNADHTAWAIHEAAADDAEVLHLNDASASRSHGSSMCRRCTHSIIRTTW